MKIASLTLAAALAVSSLAVPTVVSAKSWHNNRHHHGASNHHPRRCWTEWRHHHKVRRCR